MSATFTCPGCRAVSHNPNDIEHSYCGRCNRFWREVAPGVWDDGMGELHVDIDACLAGNGYEVNDQTRRMLTQTWTQLGEQTGAPSVVIVEEP